MVRVKGLEPPRINRQILSLVRLPVSPHAHLNCFHIIAILCAKIKIIFMWHKSKSDSNVIMSQCIKVEYVLHAGHIDRFFVMI